MGARTGRTGGKRFGLGRLMRRRLSRRGKMPTSVKSISSSVAGRRDPSSVMRSVFSGSAYVRMGRSIVAVPESEVPMMASIWGSRKKEFPRKLTQLIGWLDGESNEVAWVQFARNERRIKRAVDKCDVKTLMRLAEKMVERLRIHDGNKAGIEIAVILMIAKGVYIDKLEALLMLIRPLLLEGEEDVAKRINAAELIGKIGEMDDGVLPYVRTQALTILTTARLRYRKASVVRAMVMEAMKKLIRESDFIAAMKEVLDVLKRRGEIEGVEIGISEIRSVLSASDTTARAIPIFMNMVKPDGGGRKTRSEMREWTGLMPSEIRGAERILEQLCAENEIPIVRKTRGVK